MSEPSVTADDYCGEPSLVLRAGSYEAVLLPGIGGHLAALRDTERGLRVLREPLDAAEDLSLYMKDPIPYGMPLLFPPNRISDGSFTCCDETYRFPINEPTLNNNLHGLFQKVPFMPEVQGADERAAYAVLRHHHILVGEAVDQIFPHLLTLELVYSLSANGLRHEVRVRNEDRNWAVPLMVGFHTALRVPFAEGSTAQDCSVQVNIGERWELTERKVPSGRRLPLDAMESAIARDGGDPFAHPIDALFSAVPQGKGNECRVRDRRLGLDLVYRTDGAFPFWMLWNKDAKSGFFCPEPMTCLVNAPNLGLPWEESGMMVLGPGREWSAWSTLHVEPAEPEV